MSIRILLRVAVAGILALSAQSSVAKNIKVVVPPGAPPIVSDWHSRMGANGNPRSVRHQGMDVVGPSNLAILAAADGVVVETDVGQCWGPTVVIDHGRGIDGKPLIAAYGHIGKVEVRKGQAVKRGQRIARLGNNHKKYKCIFGVRHLHFQLGRKHRAGSKGTTWGHVRYLVDGRKGVNPHKYWADGAGRVTCFKRGVTYPAGTLTYPAACK